MLLNKVPVGKYDQIKLRYGACTVMENGSEFYLNYYTSPSEQVLNSDFEVLAENQVQLTFDFDVSRSVYKIGSYYFTFKPAIRV